MLQADGPTGKNDDAGVSVLECHVGVPRHAGRVYDGEQSKPKPAGPVRMGSRFHRPRGGPDRGISNRCPRPAELDI